MFKIYDGREFFFQWDKEQRLIVSDASVNEVHFCNKTDDCSLRREVYDYEGLRVVDVPNILFQDEMPLKVYAYCTNYTKVCATFKIHARTKPENYIYTDDEVLTWEQLNERVNQIEENGISDEAVEAAIGKYLDENPIETGATEQEAAQIEQNKNDIATIQQNYTTKDYVDKAVENVDVDLTGYATEKYVDDAIAAIDFPEGGGGGGGESIKEIEVSTTEPTDDDVVIWINPDETGEDFATKEYVDNKVGQIVVPDTSNFATKSEIPDVSGFTTMAAVEQKGYQTESQVNALIAAAGGGSGGGGEAEDYYIKNPNSLTAEDKAFLEEFYAYYVANGKTMCEIYIQEPGTTTMYLATYVRFDSLRLLLYFITATPHEFEGVSVTFNSDGSYSSSYYGTMGSDVGWLWSEQGQYMPINPFGKLMKIAGCWAGNTSEVCYLDLYSSTYGSLDAENSGTYYYFPLPRNGELQIFKVYYDGNQLYLYDSNNNDVSSNFYVKGYWYWM